MKKKLEKLLKEVELDCKYSTFSECSSIEVFGYIQSGLEDILKDIDDIGCKNCKSGELGSNSYWCDKLKLNMPLDFSCNKFESKRPYIKHKG